MQHKTDPQNHQCIYEYLVDGLVEIRHHNIRAMRLTMHNRSSFPAHRLHTVAVLPSVRMFSMTLFVHTHSRVACGVHGLCVVCVWQEKCNVVAREIFPPSLCATHTAHKYARMKNQRKPSACITLEQKSVCFESARLRCTMCVVYVWVDLL